MSCRQTSTTKTFISFHRKTNVQHVGKTVQEGRKGSKGGDEGRKKQHRGNNKETEEREE